MAARYAILEAFKGACGTLKANLVHALVLILSGNRELKLKRRELLRPDLDAQFSPLSNLFTAISKELFCDDVGKEIDEVAKANRLRGKTWLHIRKLCCSLSTLRTQEKINRPYRSLAKPP